MVGEWFGVLMLRRFRQWAVGWAGLWLAACVSITGSVGLHREPGAATAPELARPGRIEAPTGLHGGSQVCLVCLLFGPAAPPSAAGVAVGPRPRTNAVDLGSVISPEAPDTGYDAGRAPPHLA